MDTQRKQALTARADILKAMAHPTRLYILEELARGERCVCELHADTGADFSTVSKHLSVLKNAGIVRMRSGASRSSTGCAAPASCPSWGAWRM